MGYSVSWIAVRGKSKGDVLRSTRLVDTGEVDEANDSPISATMLPNGWYLLFLNKYSHSFIAPDFLVRLSTDCVVLGCQIEEHVMASSAFWYERGQCIWRVNHASEQDTYHLEIEGHPPQILSSLHAALVNQQDSEGGRNAEVDFIFDAPLDLAENLCGYRHDRWRSDWGEPVFTRLAIAN